MKLTYSVVVDRRRLEGPIGDRDEGPSIVLDKEVLIFGNVHTVEFCHNLRDPRLRVIKIGK